jgi:hypothetical protein
MYGFGADGEQGEPQAPDAAVGPKFYRDWMEKVSGQLGELKAENDRLRDAQRQQQVAEALKAKGIAPVAAQLFTGTPDKLDDWLGTYGAALAKAEGAQEGELQGLPAGTPPPTVVSSESQAAMAAIAAAGAGGAGPQSGDDQMAARLEAAATPEEFAAIMREAGNVRYR